MTKEDLRNGMTIQTRGCGSLIVFKGYIHKPDYSNGLDNYHNDMKAYTNSNWDIMAVYDKYEHCIWKRKEEKIELTLQEIADKFDINIDKLRIKD